MKLFFKGLEKVPFQVLGLFLGFLLIIAGYFNIKELKSFNIIPYSEPIYFLIGIGAVVIIASFFKDGFTLSSSSINKAKILSIENGFSTKFKNSSINVLFGRLEVVSDKIDHSLVILPANEFFDDKCIDDKRSALGAYIQEKFKNQSLQINSLISEQLKVMESTVVEKTEGVHQQSYGTGTGVLLNKPLGTDKAILLVAVTTQRAAVGLRGEISFLFQSMKTVQQVAADNRHDSVCLPLMGAGHGGVDSKASLLATLLAVLEIISIDGGHHIKNFNIVVFQPDEKSMPIIEKNIVKDIMQSALLTFR